MDNNGTSLIDGIKHSEISFADSLRQGAFITSLVTPISGCAVGIVFFAVVFMDPPKNAKLMALNIKTKQTIELTSLDLVEEDMILTQHKMILDKDNKGIVFVSGNNVMRADFNERLIKMLDKTNERV